MLDNPQARDYELGRSRPSTAFLDSNVLDQIELRPSSRGRLSPTHPALRTDPMRDALTALLSEEFETQTESWLDPIRPWDPEAVVARHADEEEEIGGEEEEDEEFEDEEDEFEDEEFEDEEDDFEDEDEEDIDEEDLSDLEEIDLDEEEDDDDEDLDDDLDDLDDEDVDDEDL